MRSPLCLVVGVTFVSALCASVFSQTLHSQLRPQYKKWFIEDVRWIITDDERRDFFKLVTDDQRDDFVAKFWERRNPTPGTKENAFKQEHYRRIAYSNEHFAAGIAGWKTDRGRIYIIYGPPDSVDTHPSAGHDPDAYPYELWHYWHLKKNGEEVSLELVDSCVCGAFELKSEPPKVH